MSHVLGDAGSAALKAGLSMLLVVLVGLSQQQTLHGAVAAGIAGLCAIGAAVIAAVQVFVPQLSFRSYIGGVAGAALDSFVHAALPVFLTAVIGILAEPDYSTWHSLIIAALTGALAAGLRAVQGSLTFGENPAPATGVARHARAGHTTLASKTTSTKRVLLPA